MKLLIINGPNLNLLGQREKGIYGEQTFESYLDELKKRFPDITLDYYQSNIEGELIDKIQQVGFDADGIEGCLELFHHFRDFRNNGIVILLLSHLDQSFHIFFGGYQVLIRISVLFHAAQLFHLLLRFFGVVPEIGFLHFTL